MKTRVRDLLRSTGRSLSPSRRGVRLMLSPVLILALVGTTGCGPTRVRADFGHYEASYAETSNREVLLNLARLEQHDPTYFFKLGQINSSYRMEAGLTGSGQLQTVTSPPATGIGTGGGTPSAIYENDPSFSFIPVSDQANFQLLLQPVSEDIFYSLYQQGWRVDQLFRLMVDRIEVTLPPVAGETGCRVEIIRNVPPQSFDGATYTGSERDLARYVTFLRVSAVVYALQKHGMLLLQGTPQFQPLDPASWIDNAMATVEAAGGGGGGGGKGGSIIPQAKDFNDAAAKNQVWELQQDKALNKEVWRLGQRTIVPKFQLSSMVPDTVPKEAIYGDNVKSIESELRKDVFPEDASLSQLAVAPELTDILEILYSGFAIGGPANDQGAAKGPCPAPGSGSVSSHLVMRSLLGLMAAAAQEQSFYDAMAKDTADAKGPQIMIAKDDLIQNIHQGLMEAEGLTSAQANAAEEAGFAQAKSAVLYFDDLVPSIERLPVLRLTWPKGTQPPESRRVSNLREFGLQVNYRGQDYVVADSDLTGVQEGQFARENETWNRDMFRLIGQLSSQVTVDISKFPLPEILQLRTD